MESRRIFLSLAQMSGFEMDYIKLAFDTNWVAPLGPNVHGFEKDLKEYLHPECSVVALNSGTAALHLAMIQLGIGKGDEVLCQSFTFAASANPIVYQGAVPVFVDSEPDTWNMSPELLEQAILDRKTKTGHYPKAIIVVHLFGMPAKLEEIMEIASFYRIPLVEDAAEALGSEYKGRKCGTFGEFSILSFNGNKIITTSGGGAMICKSAEQAAQTLFLASQARENRPFYHHEKIGYNYRMSNICAGIGRGQMHALSYFLKRRRQIHTLYTTLLNGIDGIKVMNAPDETFNSNYWLTCIMADNKICRISADSLRTKLESDNIESRLLWKPLHLQPVFSAAPAYVNGVSEKIFNMGLCLPSSPTLTDADIERVVNRIKVYIHKRTRHPDQKKLLSKTNAFRYAPQCNE